MDKAYTKRNSVLSHPETLILLVAILTATFKTVSGECLSMRYLDRANPLNSQTGCCDFSSNMPCQCPLQMGIRLWVEHVHQTLFKKNWFGDRKWDRVTWQQQTHWVTACSRTALEAAKGAETPKPSWPNDTKDMCIYVYIIKYYLYISSDCELVKMINNIVFLDWKPQDCKETCCRLLAGVTCN